ncbi:MAG: DUF4194 domain-containing protein [Lachnospiraceae bacterium]|jgi:hypothetical protein|nr:DUF4194 domain-containing protein [Lachnospiraceae bacterium]
MIEYYEQLLPEEQEEVCQAVQLLYRQTFVLERKFERRTGRLQFNRDFRVCSRHLAFLQSYFSIAGISVLENSQTGIIYLQGEALIGDKLPRLTTLYVLVLKLIYDEQMASASTSVNVFTTLADINERLGSFHLLVRQPSPTEVRRAVSLLKKYQIIEPLDLLEELEGASRLVIYPSINMLLLGDDARALIDTFRETEEEDAESEISGIVENLPE